METRKPSASNPCGKKKRLSTQKAVDEIYHDSDSGEEEDSDWFECDDDVETESEGDESEEMEALQPPPAWFVNSKSYILYCTQEKNVKHSHFVQQIIQHLVSSSIEDGDVSRLARAG